MGDNIKTQSNHAALVTCVACMLFTLVTCSFVLAQYSRWQSELTDLKEQIVKTLPLCSSSSSRKNVNTVQEATRNTATEEASMQIQDSGSTDLEPMSMTLRDTSSSAHSRLRRNAEESREGNGGRRNRRLDKKKNETRRQQSAIHMIPTGDQSTGEKRFKKQKAIQFKLDADKYKNLTGDNKTTILRWWNADDWCKGHQSDFFEFIQSTGELRILQDGLYYVYAQITYKNAASMNSFDVKIDSQKTLISCTQERRFESGSSASIAVDNCHAASVARLSTHQTLSIWNAVDGSFFRRMDNSSAATFWGVMRIGQ